MGIGLDPWLKDPPLAEMSGAPPGQADAGQGTPESARKETQMGGMHGPLSLASGYTQAPVSHHHH